MVASFLVGAGREKIRERRPGGCSGGVQAEQRQRARQAVAPRQILPGIMRGLPGFLSEGDVHRYETHPKLNRRFNQGLLRCTRRAGAMFEQPSPKGRRIATDQRAPVEPDGGAEVLG
jgi:hypothetical protein